MGGRREIFRLIQRPSFLKRDSLCQGTGGDRRTVLKTDALHGRPLPIFIKWPRCACSSVLWSGRTTWAHSGRKLPSAKGDKLCDRALADLATLVKFLGISQPRVKDVTIVGGSRIAYYLAATLLDAGIGVKIIELQHDRCLELAERLPRASIVHGDGSKKALLLSEGLNRPTPSSPLTDFDEVNLVVSMYANYLKVPKVITKISYSEYNEVFRDKGSIASSAPRCCAPMILSAMCAMENTAEARCWLSTGWWKTVRRRSNSG